MVERRASRFAVLPVARRPLYEQRSGRQERIAGLIAEELERARPSAFAPYRQRSRNRLLASLRKA